MALGSVSLNSATVRPFGATTTDLVPQRLLLQQDARQRDSHADHFIRRIMVVVGEGQYLFGEMRVEPYFHVGTGGLQILLSSELLFFLISY